MEEKELRTMYLLQYKDVNGHKNHGIFRTQDDAFHAIQDWWELNGFEPPYVRILGDEDTVKAIDYGSYDNFYYIVPINKEHFHDAMMNGVEAKGMFVNWSKYKYN